MECYILSLLSHSLMHEGVNERNEGVNEGSEGVNEGNEGVNKGNEGVSEGNEGKISVLSLIAETGGLNTNAIAARINKSTSTVERYISNLKKEGLIEFRGAPKTGGYYLIKT